jgi:hypothetical protein
MTDEQSSGNDDLPLHDDDEEEEEQERDLERRRRRVVESSLCSASSMRFRSPLRTPGRPALLAMSCMYLNNFCICTRPSTASVAFPLHSFWEEHRMSW